MRAKARTTALITPVDPEAQNEAKALAAAGHTVKAVRRLRKGSELSLLTATVAVDLLTEGHTLPTTYAEAADALPLADAPLAAELTSLLAEADTNAAIRRLRERTDLDLLGGHHLVTELNGRRDTP
ncbi:hypothetical protein GTW43_25690 [Streptomyces sp. SID5785]|uniref:hypothetical protein n=1 Tax=Streptomyces sp. SID5785 TaxID=2690309 RepID=UPI0013613B0F|nr:hypothetical protein [Streptomyces sp. SID5785]MZD04687.1 hypothetical protein [Streptomyces sp. SID5785]MZD08444.1 hypothetical protein [Streptomyces sp. SID5785]